MRWVAYVALGVLAFLMLRDWNEQQPRTGADTPSGIGKPAVAEHFAAVTAITVVAPSRPDFRRSASGIEVTEKLLAHTSGTMAGIIGIYQRHSYAEEMRDAISKWESKLTNLTVNERCRRRLSSKPSFKNHVRAAPLGGIRSFVAPSEHVSEVPEGSSEV